jgi:hypothetical protein
MAAGEERRDDYGGAEGVVHLRDCDGNRIGAVGTRLPVRGQSFMTVLRLAD